MQAILGASGVIGRGLARYLARDHDAIRVVSRNPKKVNPTDETVAADLTSADQTGRAVEGATVAYLTVGLTYRIKVWQAQWPAIMRNVIEACKKQNAKLVFFDNVYLYGRVDGWMTEETPVRPTSRKGEVRAMIVETLMQEVRRGNIRALIARAADFYGAGSIGIAQALVFDNLKKGKKAQWLVNDTVKHSLTYTPDAAAATGLLGNSEKAYGQVWHLPTAKNPLTGRELIAAAAQEFGVMPSASVVGPLLLRLAGLFNGDIRESVEMLYQYDSDYLFDSSKFERAFPFGTTPYAKGVKETVSQMNRQ